ncbi:hypothetical protein CRUP_005143, partial [Coryphaenoides rupestris]
MGAIPFADPSLHSTSNASSFSSSSSSPPSTPPRDFAYVARDKNTRILKCHVFRCDTPAKAIATSLHEICSR